MRKRSIVALILLVALFAAANVFSIITPVQNALAGVLAPVQQDFWSGVSGIASITSRFFATSNLTAERDEAVAELTTLRSHVAELAQLEEENQALRDQLDITEADEFEVRLATITGVDATGDALVINAGLRDGLAVGQPVITADKILWGSITEVHANWSSVQLITHPDSSFIGQVLLTDVTGLVRGQGGYAANLEEVSQDAHLETGSVIVTSHLSHDVPPGLLVGEIVSVSQADIEPLRKAHLDTFFALENTSHLLVITRF